MVPYHRVSNRTARSHLAISERATEGANERATELRQQVYLRLRHAIDDGTFAPGARLPASREQARVLGVSRNTVLWAVERLGAGGYLVARVGDGTYVSARRGRADVAATVSRSPGAMLAAPQL